MKRTNTKNSKGITLVALIITVVVLLILAAVAIRAIKDDGIINHAKNARVEYEAGEQRDENLLSPYIGKLEEHAQGLGSGSGNGESKAPLVDEAGNDAKNKVLSKTANIDVYDEYGNKIVVPAGFMIRVDESTTYADHVTEGIVIEDCTEAATAGSQFVWVPVGTIYTNAAKTEYKTINLDRYTFAEDGTPTPQGDAVIDDYYQELATSTYGNATAKDLQGFINSVNAKGGYYIGRYEAGNSNSTLVCKANQAVYRNVTQPEASSLSRGMYESSNFTSDLINSYAWDTAIVFIQTFGGCADYANKNFSTSSEKTGINNDKYCNIYDMSGNTLEWSTETCSMAYYPCISRGGCYDTDDGSAYGYTSFRNFSSTTGSFSGCSFRPLLYVAL